VRYVISADIGTQGTKTALIEETGRIVATAFRPSQLHRAAGGVVEQHPEDMVRSVVDGIRDAMAQAQISGSDIVAIGMDGQMAGILGIDRDGHAVTPYDSWLDSRCESAMPEIKAWGEEDYIRITGCPVTYAHGPKKLWWKRERPEVYARIAKFVVPSAYVAGKLAGLSSDEAYIDHTHLHFSGFADVERMAWSDTLLNAFGIDAAKLPRIVRPWDVIGTLRRTYAEASGLPEGVPIVAGCGDTAAAIFGAGIVRPGRLLDIAGTASVLACAVDAYRPDADAKTLLFARSVLPELWTPLAYINGGGECMAWYRRLVGSGEGADALSFDQLNAMAERVEAGCDGLLFLPHFNGRVCPNDTELRGAWLGLNWAHDRGAMYRAILESIAYEYKQYLDILEGLSGPIGYSYATVVGGGANGELFNRIKSDVLGVPYRRLHSADSAMTANAVIAGYGVGLYPDLAAAAESFLAYDSEVQPNEHAMRTYRPYADRYREAVEGMAALYGKLAR